MNVCTAPWRRCVVSKPTSVTWPARPQPASRESGRCRTELTSTEAKPIEGCQATAARNTGTSQALAIYTSIPASCQIPWNLAIRQCLSARSALGLASQTGPAQRYAQLPVPILDRHAFHSCGTCRLCFSAALPSRSRLSQSLGSIYSTGQGRCLSRPSVAAALSQQRHASITSSRATSRKLCSTSPLEPGRAPRRD